jgi:polysaccharide export outer membrane protein
MIRYQLKPLSMWVFVIAALILASASWLMAQNQAGATPPGPGTQPAASPAASAKIVAVPIKIAPGDLLEVTVFDAPELTQQVRVGSDGKVQLAPMGETMLAGLTGQEAGKLIARELRERQFLVHPQVNVLIKEFSSQGVSVVGEVQHPGVYQILGPRTLLDVISLAGGLTNLADTRVTIKRRIGTTENVTVRLKNDDVQTSITNDVQVNPGDLVMVARAGLVYVMGEVNRPGGFVMQDNGHITVLQALAQAGGASRTASANKAVLLRKNEEGYTHDKIRLGRISRGQDQDISLHANDIVFVPSSRMKDALRETQSVANSLGSASIYAVVH